MARPVRVEFEDASYHVMARGNGRQQVFFDDSDRQLFVQTLGEALGPFGLELIAWVLMPNHYHLILRTPRGNLSRSMGWFQTTFTVRYNRRHRRVGHLFQGRYKAQVVEASSHAARLIPYVHLNPVRRHKRGKVVLVGTPKELDGYAWSSHPDYAGLRKQALLPLCWDWLSGSGGTVKQARQAYRQQMAQIWELGLVECPWDDLAGGLVLGSERFEEKVRRKMNQRPAVWSRDWVARRTQPEVQRMVRRLLKGEPDQRVRLWARVRLAGERLVDVGREEGFADGSGVLQAVKRLEARAKDEPALQKRLDRLQDLSNVKS
jgi:REP element-mobilizing transposase RayT